MDTSASLIRQSLLSNLLVASSVQRPVVRSLVKFCSGLQFCFAKLSLIEDPALLKASLCKHSIPKQMQHCSPLVGNVSARVFGPPKLLRNRVLTQHCCQYARGLGILRTREHGSRSRGAAKAFQASYFDEERRRIEEKARQAAWKAEMKAKKAADKARSKVWVAEDPDYLREQFIVYMRQERSWTQMLVPLLGAVGLGLLFGPLILSLLFTGLAIAAFLMAGMASLTVVSMIAPFALGFGALWLFTAGFGLLASTSFFLLQPFIALAMLGSGLFLGTSMIRSMTEGGSRRSRRQARNAGTGRGDDFIDIEIEEDPLEAAARETEEMRKFAQDDLQRFDELLKKRAREKEIDKGNYWKP
eukprot:jgi/Botrbrau1/19107/Bobra.0077s0021.1